MVWDDSTSTLEIGEARNNFVQTIINRNGKLIYHGKNQVMKEFYYTGNQIKISVT